MIFLRGGFNRKKSANRAVRFDSCNNRDNCTYKTTHPSRRPSRELYSFLSDAFGSYTTRRQSDKQTNSSGTEIWDHDNDSTRRPSVPGDNETQETAHTPTIKPR
ncbi:hypothetical protein ALC57_14983 [Trachymyrmex cornetzi]|uniref:Uncharacterized protein n=1 Tax=Trachymyrmex cornetzi TaxID=471704 RepID=A0A195DJ53_9HYME|nr:hypothetical protein ALC57_14983 [Trachymyrmex cornetzi]